MTVSSSPSSSISTTSVPIPASVACVAIAGATDGDGTTLIRTVASDEDYDTQVRLVRLVSASLVRLFRRQCMEMRFLEPSVGNIPTPRVQHLQIYAHN